MTPLLRRAMQLSLRRPAAAAVAAATAAAACACSVTRLHLLSKFLRSLTRIPVAQGDLYTCCH